MSVGDAKSQADFANIQNALANGPWGSISKQELATHSFGVDTERVLGNALDKYIQLVYASGKDATPIMFQQYLGQASGIDPRTGKPKPGYAASLSGSGSSGPTLELANAEDLKTTAQQAAVAALGQALPEDALNSFVDNFHNLQQQRFNQEVNGSPTVTDAPSASTAALDFVKQQEPHEFAQNEVRTYANALINELLSGSSQMPSGNLDTLAAMNG